MTAHNRKLKNASFLLDGVEYAQQLTSLKMTNDTDDPEITFVFIEGQEFADAADPSWSLALTFVADWTTSGISTYLTEHDGDQVDFTLGMHTDIPTDHVQWDGQVKIKAPDVGGDVRDTETTEITLAVVGVPVFSRP